MSAVDALRVALAGHLSPLSLDSVLRRAIVSGERSVLAIAPPEREQLAAKLEQSVALFSSTDRTEIRRIVRAALHLEEPVAREEGAMRSELAIRAEMDVNVARSEARRVAIAVGLGATMAVKVATAVSELTRNIVLYAGEGALTIEGERDARPPFVRITARDEGPGIDAVKLEAVLSGAYVSRSGLGKGIAAVRRIASSFEITSKPGAGTKIVAELRGN